MKHIVPLYEFLNEANKSYQDIARELVEIAAFYTDVDLSDDMTNAMKCDDEDKVLVFYGDLKEMMKEEEPGKYKEFEKEATAFLAKNKINESVSINEKLSPAKLMDAFLFLITTAAQFTSKDLSHLGGQVPRDLDDAIRMILAEIPQAGKKKFTDAAEDYIKKNKLDESVNEGKQADIVIPANDASDLEEEGNYIKDVLKKAGVNAGFETGIGEIEIYLKSKSDLGKAKKTLDKDGLQYKVNEGKTIGALSDEDDEIYVEAKDLLAQELQKAYEEVGKKVQKVIAKATNKGLIVSNLKAQAANDLVDVYRSKFLHP